MSDAMTEDGTIKEYFSTQTPNDVSSYEHLKDGSLLIHDVLIMAEGEWTSSEGIRAVFTPELLQRDAQKWKDNTFWAKHPGGMPRNVVTDTLGAVINPRFDPKAKSYGEDGKVTEIQAVVADLLIHGKTDASAGAITLFQLPEEAGGIRSVSAETVLTFDKKTDELVGILFTGTAAVRRGACAAVECLRTRKPQEMEIWQQRNQRRKGHPVRRRGLPAAPPTYLSGRRRSCPI